MTRRLTPPPRRRTPGARPGFSLVEVLVTTILVTVGLLAVAGMAINAVRTTRSGSIQTVAAAVAQSRFDSLASVPCNGLASNGATAGTAEQRGIVERWRVIDGRNVKELTDSLRVPTRAGWLVYRSVIPCRDL